MFEVFHISLKNVASVFVWCFIVDLDVAHVADVLFECCKYVIWMLHFSSRELNVSINMKHMLRRVRNSFSYVVTGLHLIFYGWLSTFFNIFLMLQTLNFNVADVEFRCCRLVMLSFCRGGGGEGSWCWMLHATRVATWSQYSRNMVATWGEGEERLMMLDVT
jgi:hypothetical protein